MEFCKKIFIFSANSALTRLTTQWKRFRFTIMSLVMLKVNHSSHTFHTFPQIFIFCFFVSDNILKGKYTLFHTLSLYFTHYSILFFLNLSCFLCVIFFCFIHNFTQLNTAKTIKILFFQRFVEFTSANVQISECGWWTWIQRSVGRKVSWSSASRLIIRWQNEIY